MNTKIEEMSQQNLNSIDMDVFNISEEDMEFGGKVETTQNNTNSKPEQNNKPKIMNNNVNNNEDYSGINEIDMEFNVPKDFLDDEDSLEHKIDYKDSENVKNENSVVTGIMINLNTDEDDYDYYLKNKNKKNKCDDIYDLEDEICFTSDVEENKEEPILEKKKPLVKIEKYKPTKRNVDVMDGSVSANYWDNLAKRHRSTNTKGAYNTSFRLVGNPERETELFNHMMGSDYGVSDGDVTGVSSGDGGSMGESKNTDTSKKLLEEFLVIAGLDLKQDSDKYYLSDKYNILPTNEYNDLDGVMIDLRDYLIDYIILPLQKDTGENFENPEEWVNWYKDNSENYPQCSKDIEYCKLFVRDNGKNCYRG